MRFLYKLGQRGVLGHSPFFTALYLKKNQLKSFPSLSLGFSSYQVLSYCHNSIYLLSIYLLFYLESDRDVTHPRFSIILLRVVLGWDSFWFGSSLTSRQCRERVCTGSTHSCVLSLARISRGEAKRI